MSLISRLPKPQHDPLESDLLDDDEPVVTTRAVATTTAPPYGHRKGWVPRREEDFADGGAFPEIHVAQYPLGMGAQEGSGKSKALSQTLDAEGKVRYDAIARQGHANDRIVYSKLRDMAPKTVDEESLRKPSEEEVEETKKKTEAALGLLVDQKLAAAAPVRRAEKTAPAQYIRYTPSNQGTAFNSGAKQRVVRLVEAQRDPMEPPKFKINKKIPRGPPSPPAPVLHSPNRKVTAKEQQEWKIPPCISNWKNLKGYTIPLDKRVAADGRGLQSVHINENFAKLAEALYIAERKAREAVETRSQIEKKVAQREKEKREEQLLKIAQQARETLPGGAMMGANVSGVGADEGLRDREELRRERARERARDRNLARASHETRSKVQRERERDVTEQLALGAGAGGRGAKGPDALFDQRLFNQSRGMDSGFAGGEDEHYNVYDRPWKPGGDRSDGAHLYRPKKTVDEDSYGDELDKLSRQRRFVPDKGFADSDRLRRLDGPVQFEKDEEDPFGLNKFLSEAKKAQKRPTSSAVDGEAGPSGRKRDHRD